MKIGDIVRLKETSRGRPGVVTEFVDWKCWRTEKHGKTVDWKKIDAEKHAVVLFIDGVVKIPIVDLEVIDATR